MPVNDYGVQNLAPLLVSLEQDLARLAAERAAAESAWQQRRLAISEKGRGGEAPLRAELAAIDVEARTSAAVTAERARLTRRLERITTAATRLRREAREQLERQVEAIRQAEATALRDRLAQQSVGRGEVLRGLATVRQRIQVLETALRQQSGRLGIQPRGVPDVSPREVPLGTDATRALDSLTAQCDGQAAILARIVDSAPARCCRLPGRIGLHLLAALPALAIFLLDGGVATAVAALVLLQIVVAVLVLVLRRPLASRLELLLAALADLGQRAAAIERLAMAPAKVSSEPAESAEERQAKARAESERITARVREREARLRARVQVAIEPSALAAGELARRQAETQRAEVAARAGAAEAVVSGAIAEADRVWEAERDRCATISAQRIAEVQTVAAAAAERSRVEHPAWEAPAWDGWKPSTSWPAGLPLGQARHPQAAGGTGLAVPVALGFPRSSCLLVRSAAGCRPAAIELICQSLLRALVSAPPAGIRLTLIDPVGLGQGFAPLLGLADHGEAVLPGGVATDTERIDRALDDLCAHVEAVIRTRLRGRFEDIVAYNAQAGELQEAVRLVAIADFPSGFGERAQERLAVLLRTGARCGVHVLLHHDQRVRLSPAIDAALVQQAELVLREEDGALIPDHPAFAGWTFAPEGLPPAATAARLASAAGAAAVRAHRVEVPFSALAPPAGQRWSVSTADRLRIPIGLRGAGQLQYLELGRGTAQHVLIGGRTGSGKSTLLHVLVTSAALWFHPRELEVHLIDFKKGVEFQAYAATKLPHARVVAVESDREFGLSVLRRLDGELTRRGDLFRAVGAQDLAAHRRAGGEHLPRVLLLIDEFQEFFTEDDAIARDAALLLDRFVRQGRAFGVHVVLGSQTLSGSYSLAKSSLGQMGVRIVLPCNEADAHLLLHEDNDAVRLLTRPGEGIYNDQAGLAEGNSPFQVCWLSDQQRSDALRPLAARAAADGWKPSSPTVIFAGDAPARLDEDAGLAALLAAPPVPRTAASVGQSSSLRGSAEVLLPAASGGNLLLVGQHREAACATLAALAIGLAARHPVGGLRLLAFDGEEAGGPFAGLWGALGAALPHGASRIGGRELAPALAELATLLERRQSGEDPSRTPVLLAINALQRLRALRPDDDAPFDRSGEPLSDRFAKLIAGGPEYGIHAAVWCDSLAGVQRSMSRKSLRDFDLRICFQMSPADSTELLDDDGASRLGLHSALLAVLTEGRREKFRPYQAPDAAFLSRIGAALRAR